MKNKKKVLITGVAGFLGSHLVDSLLKKNLYIVGIDNFIGGYEDNVSKDIEFHNVDCCDFHELNLLMDGVEIVYHCAATAHEGLSVF